MNLNPDFDEYDFTPSESTNLASLFGGPVATPQSHSLTYTAPKQPKSNSNVPEDVKSEKKQESSVICAKAVTLWKLINNKYEHLGVYGIALIGSGNIYEMILYKEKQNIIVQIKLIYLQIEVKKDDFISFFDKTSQNWLVKFNNKEDFTIILKKIESLGGKVIQFKKEELSEQRNNSPDPDIKSKSDILTRISKMGQSMLPNNKTTIEDAEISSKIYSEEKIEPICKEIVVSPQKSQSYPVQSQNLPTNTIIVGHQPNYDLNLYFSENRTHNAEVRINLGQISDKLNNVLKIVETGTNSSPNENVLKSKVKVLQLKIENLNRDLAKTEEKYDKLLKEQKINENMDQIKINMMKERKFKELEDEFGKVKEELSNSETRLKDMSEELENVERQFKEAQIELKIKNDEIFDLKSTIIGLENEIKHQETKNNEEVSIKDENDRKLFIESLKENMNEMYGNIIQQFDGNTQYSHTQIQKIVAQNIKSGTLKLIQDYDSFCSQKLT